MQFLALNIKAMNEYTINMKDFEQVKENYIHPTAIIGPNVTMGTGNYIGPYCIIGYPAEHKEYWKGEHYKTHLTSSRGDSIYTEGNTIFTGKVEIGNNNTFTGLVTVDAGTEGITSIGDNCWFLKHSHVGHDSVIGDNVTISCGAKVGGHSIINNNCNIGLNACLHQWTDLPEGVMVGMGAIVTKKTQLEPFRKYAGVPARDIGSNIRE